MDRIDLFGEESRVVRERDDVAEEVLGVTAAPQAQSIEPFVADS